MNAEAIDHLSPLAADLRAQNPDRYLATLFAPPACRSSLIALYAFDHELSRVQTIVTEPMAGLIRLQWWQDVIDGFSNHHVVAHPVVRELRRAVSEGGLDSVYLERAIKGRRLPLEQDEAPNVETFERYLLDVGGNITLAAASLLGSEQPAVLRVAERIGLVSAALEQLRFLDKPTSGHRAWLPAAWGEERDGDAGGDPHAAARKQLAALASTALAEARRHKTPVERTMLPALFPGTLAGLRLARSEPRSRGDTACERGAEIDLVLDASSLLIGAWAALAAVLKMSGPGEDNDNDHRS